MVQTPYLPQFVILEQNAKRAEVVEVYRTRLHRIEHDEQHVLEHTVVVYTDERLQPGLRSEVKGSPSKKYVHQEEEEVEAAADDEHVEERDLPHDEVAVSREAGYK